jgi:O-antigen biosynthesis protein WbqP
MKRKIIKRSFDFILSSILIILLIIPFVCISLLIIISTKESPIYLSKRIGQNKKIFIMPKFRTMRKETPQLATHLLKNSNAYLSKIGTLLRKTSIDELPQIWSIFIGDMSFVGPRPALFNQYDLIKKRDNYNINDFKPGISGYAQINGRDGITIDEKVKLDSFYVSNQSFFLDAKILFLTLLKVFKSENISH